MKASPLGERTPHAGDTVASVSESTLARGIQKVSLSKCYAETDNKAKKPLFVLTVSTRYPCPGVNFATFFPHLGQICKLVFTPEKLSTYPARSLVPVTAKFSANPYILV